jgi:hypothetical protein
MVNSEMEGLPGAGMALEFEPGWSLGLIGFPNRRHGSGDRRSKGLAND